MRVLILMLVGVLIVACAGPTASWRPLNGQDAGRIERDWATCQPYRSTGQEIMLVLLAPWAGITPGIIEQRAIFLCMEGAGYEWVGRSPRE